MAAVDRDRNRPDMPVSGDVVRESMPLQAETPMADTGRARDTARQTAESAQRAARSALSTQKERVASSLDDIIEVLHVTGEQLRNHDRTSLAGYANQAADRLDQFARILHDRDVGELIADAEDYTRRHPEIVLGGALVLGLLVSRFLKSTSYRPEYEGERMYGRERAQVGTGMPEERMPYQSRGTGI